MVYELLHQQSAHLDQFDHYRRDAQNMPSSSNSSDAKIELLKKAAALYHGSLFTSASGEHWLIPTEVNYRLKYNGVINELMRELSAIRSYSLIQEYAGMALQVDPRNADAYFWLITALNQLGSPEIAQSELNMAKEMLLGDEFDTLRKQLNHYAENKTMLIRLNTQIALGNGKVFSTSDFEAYGYPSLEPICNYMNEMFYEATIQYDVYPIAMRFAFSNSDIIYSHAHGGDDVIVLANNTRLRSNDITANSMRNVDLVYLSSCHAGNVLLDTLCSTGGAKAGVGFTDTIYVSTNPGGGIYYFDKMFFFYLREQRHSINRCCEMALLATETKYGKEAPYGSGNYITYGELEY